MDKSKIKFGVPLKRNKRKEFNEITPSLRIEASRGEGTSKRIFINTLGLKLINVEPGSNVMIGFIDEDAFITGAESTDVNSYRVTNNKDHSFSNSKMYDHLVNTYFNGDDSIHHDIELIETGEDSIAQLDLTYHTDCGSDAIIGGESGQDLSWDEEVDKAEADVDGIDELSKSTIEVDC